MIHKSVRTNFCKQAYEPAIDPTAFVHPLAAAIGHIYIGKRVLVAPFASVRGDEGHPLFVGDDSNIQDGVVIHALETEHNGTAIEKNRVEVEGKKYAVYIGRRVSLAHQVQVHGPAMIGNDTFIGMQSLVFQASVGNNCVVEPGSVLMGISVIEGRYVPAGSVLKNQKDADNLPEINPDYPFRNLNQGVVQVNTRLAAGYQNLKFEPQP